MKMVNAYTKNYKSKELGKKSVGKLFIGSQSCYDKPSVLITFENNEYSAEIQIPKEMCEEIGNKIIEYGKLLEDECDAFPISRSLL